MRGDLIRVLQIIDQLGMGGAETWLMELLRFWSIRDASFQIEFLAASGQRGLFDEEAERLGAKIHYIRYGRRHLPQFALAFRTLLRRRQYSAVHDHQDFTSGWHFLLASGTLPPVRVTHVHNPSYQVRNNYGVTLNRRVTTRIGKSLVARYSTHLTATSRQVLTEYGFDEPVFRHIPKGALYCGFDPKRFQGDKEVAKASLCSEFGWPLHSKIILFAGRIDQSPDLGHPQNHKNSGFAVSVGIDCMRRDPYVRMVLAGAASPAIPTLQGRITTAGFADRIVFAGIRKDIERLMLGSDVLLFPSRAEGLGMVVVEAQAACLPALVSATVPRECVVVPELVEFQSVEAGEAAWSSALLHLMTKRSTSKDSNARVAASAFSIEGSARALERLYTEGKLS